VNIVALAIYLRFTRPISDCRLTQLSVSLSLQTRLPVCSGILDGLVALPLPPTPLTFPTGCWTMLDCGARLAEQRNGDVFQPPSE
jgi:hypothetical protein